MLGREMNVYKWAWILKSVQIMTARLLYEWVVIYCDGYMIYYDGGTNIPSRLSRNQNLRGDLTSR